MEEIPSPPTDAELIEAVSAGPSGGASGPARIIRRRRSEYRTSFPLEEVDLVAGEGVEVKLAVKRLDWSGLEQRARIAKPRFLHDPRREPAVYGGVLGPTGLSAPRYYGSVIDDDLERHWLLVEWIDGRELYQVGDRSLWERAAEWLGGMHRRLAPDVDRHAEAGRLLEHDAVYYRRWMSRAREFACSPDAPPARRAALEWLGDRHEAVVDALTALPRTVLHGEFYASNVLVGGEAAPPRVAPVDWELAAVGPGLEDLAALLSGDWAEPDRTAIASAYAAAVEADASPRSLGLARLQVAIQWLGWAPPSWIPPEGQRHDWLAEALGLAEELCL